MAATTCTTMLRPAVEPIEFGEIDDYYPDSEIDDARREKWEGDSADWEESKHDLLEALEEGDLATARHALDAMSAVERVWGDDPATQQIRKIVRPLMDETA